MSGALRRQAPPAKSLNQHSRDSLFSQVCVSRWQVKKFRADLKYHLLAIDGVCENEPDRYQGLLKRLEKDLRGWPMGAV